MNNEQVILVTEKDDAIGVMDKLQAHAEGVLHRAFSIFVFNTQGAMLLQQRARHKYHSGGLWTNACCSHPRPGESVIGAAKRRLKEEMGFETAVEKIFHFTYQAEFDNGLKEYEFDHVLTGEYNGPVSFNPEEVQATCYKSMYEIEKELQESPHTYTAWFRLAFPNVLRWWKTSYENIELKS